MPEAEPRFIQLKYKDLWFAVYGILIGRCSPADTRCPLENNAFSYNGKIAFCLHWMYFELTKINNSVVRDNPSKGYL
jgi:hypothetical protein